MTVRYTNFNILFLLLLSMLFIGVLNTKVGSISYLLPIVFICIFFLFKFKTNQVNNKVLFYLGLMILSLYISSIYQYIEYNTNNLYYIRFFGAQVFFFLLIIFFVNIEEFKKKYLEKFLLFIITVVFISVIIDYFLIKMGLESYSLMYKEYANSYKGKPLGVFGQFSITTSYIVFFYLLLKNYKINISKYENMILFFMVTVVILLENSGTGYIAYMMLLYVMFSHYSKSKYMMFPMITIFMILVLTNHVQKISIDYLSFLYTFVENIIFNIYIHNINNVFDLLFGLDGNFNFPIDFGPLFLISKVGLLYFILYSFAIFYLIYKNRSRYFRMAIFVLLFANLHYSALFYPVMNIVLPTLLVITLNKNKRYDCA